MVNGKMRWDRAKVAEFGLTQPNMWDNGNIKRQMWKEFFTILKEISTKEISRMTSRMVKGLIKISVDLSNMLESGRKAKKTDLVLMNRYFQFLGAENMKATGNVTRFTDMEWLLGQTEESMRASIIMKWVMKLELFVGHLNNGKIRIG